HVAGAAAIHLAIAHHARKGIDAPAMSGLHDIDVAVEMDAGTRSRTFAPRHDIDARMALAVAGRAFGPDIFDREAALLEPAPEKLRTRTIRFARWIDGREA